MHQSLNSVAHAKTHICKYEHSYNGGRELLLGTFPHQCQLDNMDMTAHVIRGQ